jgi:hypothetical protein
MPPVIERSVHKTGCMSPMSWSGSAPQHSPQGHWPESAPVLRGGQGARISNHRNDQIRRTWRRFCQIECDSYPEIWGSSTRSDNVRFCSLRTPVPRARPPDYDQSSARRDHQASAAVIAPSASRMPSPTSPAVAAQCRGIRARAPGSQRCSSRVSGSGAVPS